MNRRGIHHFADFFRNDGVYGWGVRRETLPGKRTDRLPSAAGRQKAATCILVSGETCLGGEFLWQGGRAAPRPGVRTP